MQARQFRQERGYIALTVSDQPADPDEGKTGSGYSIFLQSASSPADNPRNFMVIEKTVGAVLVVRHNPAPKGERIFRIA